MTGENAYQVGRRLIFRQTGPPELVLEIEHFECFKVPLREGEVRVRILAAPINPADLNTVEGTYGVKLPLPGTPGIEGCGEVMASASPEFAEGDYVLFLRRASSWASHVTMAGQDLFKIPATLDPLQTAMLKVNPATAWRLIHGSGPLEEGAWLVQNAGNSAVGRCVIQLARDLGLRTLSFVRSAALFPELRALGADEVCTDDADGAAAGLAAMGGAKAALGFNAVGGDSALRLMKLLREGASHITYGAMSRKPLTVPNGLLIFRDIHVRGLWVTRWIEQASAEEVHGVYAELAARVAAGRLVMPVDSTYPLEDFRAALDRLNSPERRGKILFVP